MSAQTVFRLVMCVALGGLAAGCLNGTEQAAVRDWLSCQECADGQRDSLLALHRDKPWRTTRFIGEQIYDKSYFDNLDRRLANEFDLATDGSLDRDAFVASYASNFVSLYRSRAIQALAEIGTAPAVGILRAAASDGSLRTEIRLKARRAAAGSFGGLGVAPTP